MKAVSHFLILLLFPGFLLSCAASESSLYLWPGRAVSAAPPAVASRPLVLLQPFREELSPPEIVGGHHFRSSRQVLKVEPGHLSQTLTRLIAAQLAEQEIPHTPGTGWNGTPAGLQSQDTPARLVVAGRINRLWLDVRSGLTHTKYIIDLTVKYDLGVPAEKKVLSREVHVSQEMVKFNSQPEVMEEVIRDNLAEAARQVAVAIDGAI